MPANYRICDKASGKTKNDYFRACLKAKIYLRTEIEFHVCNTNSMKNYIFCALKDFIKLEFMPFNKKILHWYEVKRMLYTAI